MSDPRPNCCVDAIGRDVEPCRRHRLPTPEVRLATLLHGELCGFPHQLDEPDSAEWRCTRAAVRLRAAGVSTPPSPPRRPPMTNPTPLTPEELDRLRHEATAEQNHPVASHAEWQRLMLRLLATLDAARTPDVEALAEVLHREDITGRAIHEDRWAMQVPSWSASASECDACQGHAAAIIAALATLDDARTKNIPESEERLLDGNR